MNKIVATDELPSFPETISDDARDFVISCLQRDPNKRLNVFKLLTNSTYGEFAQNTNNFTHAKICLDEKELQKATNSNCF